MIERRRAWERLATTSGVLCLLATLLLLSTGVRTVRADAGEEALMSIDPLLEAQLGPPPAAPQPAAPPTLPTNVLPPSQPGAPPAEIQSGVIVLNTRGFNYGPPRGEIEPGAMRHERAPTRPTP